jgi:hypothetical protein
MTLLLCRHQHIFFVLTVAFAPVAASAQYDFAKRKNEASVYVYGGWTSLQYMLAGGSHSGTWGGGAGAGYTYYFNDTWALLTGLEAGTFGASTAKDLLLSGKHERHSDNIRPNDMILQGKYVDYSENQTALYGHIPLMLQMLIPMTIRDDYLYVSAGLKLGMMFSGSFQNTFNELTISAYLPFSDALIENVQSLGFVSKKNAANMYDANGSLSLKFNVSATVEGGVRWAFEDGAALYTGIYIDYGLNNLQRISDNAVLMSTEIPNIFTYHSILESKYEQQAVYPSPNAPPPVISEQYVNKINLFAMGLKVKLSFNASGIPIVTRRVRYGCSKDCY